MKLIHYILIFIVFIGCSHENEPEKFSISANHIELSWNAECQDIELYANKKWEINSELPDWLSVNIQKGSDKHVTILSIAAQNNTTDKARSFDLWLSSETQSCKVTIVQLIKGKLFFKEHFTQFISASDSLLIVPIERNINYSIDLLDNGIEWISDFTDKERLTLFTRAESSTPDKIRLNISPNYTPKNRSARLVISNSQYHLSDTITIIQEQGLGYHPDGEVVTLQYSSIGNANLIIMGDGFTTEDLLPKGFYDECIQKAAQYFFNIEPYSTYQNYFNVYAVYAASQEKGVSNQRNKVNNKFKSTYGSGTSITCDDGLVLRYAKRVTKIPEGKPLTIIVVLNDNKYAGTTFLSQDGNSIALCPMSEAESPNDFEGIIHHEVGGHGFGFLCDEYVYNQQKMPDNRINNIKEWQKLGFQMNLDFTADLDKILWKNFIGLDGYEMVGAYEGGYEYQYGVWRCEENSCMNNNIPYFNVQSRWTIVNRIFEMSDKNLTLNDFLSQDVISPISATTRAIPTELPPLGQQGCIKIK